MRNIRHPKWFLKSRLIRHDTINQRLPRNIRVSDIDFVLDNDGHFLFVEFKRAYDNDLDREASWDEMGKGQRRMYENLVKAGGGKITVALCKYWPKKDEADSLTDVLGFALMKLDGEGNIAVSQSFPAGEDGRRWGRYIDGWFQRTTEATCTTNSGGDAASTC